MRPGQCGWGYLCVCLYRNGKGRTRKVHQLVVEAFLGVCPRGFEINHRDGDKENNALHNLEWVTASENLRHAFRTGLRSNAGSAHPAAKLTEEQASEIRRLTGKVRQPELASRYGVSQQTISSIQTGVGWKHV